MRLCAWCQHEIKEQMRFCPFCGAVLPEAEDENLIGTLVGDYHIKRKIGESRFGTLYSAIQVSIGLKVIVHALYPVLFSGRSAIGHLQQIIHALAACDNPDIAEIRDYGFSEATRAPYLVLQFFDGVTLAERTKEKPLDFEEAVETIVHIASAVQAAHEAGVFHSALTPQSIWLKFSDGATRVTLTDLALSAAMAATETDALAQQVTLSAASAYLSPEQSRGRQGDARSDIYSLGIIAYEMLAGNTPFHGTSAIEIMTKHINESPMPLRHLRPEISSKMEAAIMRALEKDPLKRQPSAGEFAEEVEGGSGVSVLCSRGWPSAGQFAEEVEGGAEAEKPFEWRLATVAQSVEDAHLAFCEHCGEQIEVDQLYCRHCGSRQPSPSPAALGYPAPGEAPVAPLSSVPEARPLYVDESVQFTIYRPRTVRPLVWSTLLAFAHLAERRSDAQENDPDPVGEVQRQAQQLLGEGFENYQKTIQDSSQAIPSEGEITFIPTAPGIEFNPPTRTFKWQESVHREDFRLRASQSLDGQTARGRLSVFLGSILLAEVTMSIRVDSKQASDPASFEPASARCYRKIFASYSHLDSVIVDQFEHFAQAFGDEYLRDVSHLRAGEVWSDRLEKMIIEADIFQLFWSTNSMTSEFVRREWEFALSRRQPSFIRPTYWEEPLPAAPERNLPPEELSRLHFQLISPRLTWRAPVSNEAPTVATSRYPAIRMYKDWESPEAPTPVDRSERPGGNRFAAVPNPAGEAVLSAGAPTPAEYPPTGALPHAPYATASPDEQTGTRRRFLRHWPYQVAALLLVSTVSLAVLFYFQSSSSSPLPSNLNQSSELIPVLITVVEGGAEVYRDGRLIGVTPFTLRARAGQEIRLTLRAAGYIDRNVVLNVTESNKVYNFAMEAARSTPAR